MLKWFKPLLNYHTPILQPKKKKKKTEIKWSVWYGDIENATRFYSPVSRKQIYYKIMEYYNIFNAKYIITLGGLTDVTTQLQN